MNDINFDENIKILFNVTNDEINYKNSSNGVDGGEPFTQS